MADLQEQEQHLSLPKIESEGIVLQPDDPLPSVTVDVIEEGKAWVLRNVYSKEECERIIAAASKIGLSSLSKEFRSDYRVSDRVIVDGETLTKDLYRRILPFIPPLVTVSEEEEEDLGVFVAGNWRVCGINPHLRVCRYVNGGFFCAHRDGFYLADENHRSFYTAMLYLNGEFEGGETNFLDLDKSHVPHGPALRMADKDAVTYSIKPDAGLVLLFWHPMLHEGAIVSGGEKWMMRSEVMFERDLTTSEPMSPGSAEGMRLLDLAINEEADGKYDDAAKHYRLAARKSRRIADFLKI